MDSDCARRISASSFEDETFEKMDLGGASFAGKELTRCTFRHSKLPETAWERARLEDCVFDGCDLTSFRPKQMSLRGVEFRECKLLGVAWTDLGSDPTVGFTDCSMRYQSFVSLKLQRTPFLRCSIVDSSFIEVDLAKATFRECDLAKTQFERCELAGADFSTSRGVYFDTLKNRAKGARISVETAALMATALGLRVSGYEVSNER